MHLSPVSLSVFSIIPDLLFDCSRVLEYAKIRTVLQSTESHSTRKFGTSHDFSHYFSQLWVQNLTFLSFWGLARLHIFQKEQGYGWDMDSLSDFVPSLSWVSEVCSKFDRI